MKLHEAPMGALDTETTGTNSDDDRIVQFALVLNKTPADIVLEEVVNPGRPIPKGASDVHGITDEIAAERGIDPAEAVGMVVDVLTTAKRTGIPIVIFNAPFDLTILREEAFRHGICSREDFPVPLVYDPMVVDKQIDPYRKGKRNLTATARHYGIPFDESTAHGALADSQVALAIARKQLEKVRPEATFASLHADQQVWKASQMANFRQYLARSGKSVADAKGDWPIERYDGADTELLTKSSSSVAG